MELGVVARPTECSNLSHQAFFLSLFQNIRKKVLPSKWNFSP